MIWPRLFEVGVATIKRHGVRGRLGGRNPVTRANEAALRRALEAAGVEFIDNDGDETARQLHFSPIDRS